LIGKPEGKRPLGRWRHRWLDNMEIDLKEVVWEGLDWINLAQDSQMTVSFSSTLFRGVILVNYFISTKTLPLKFCQPGWHSFRDVDRYKELSL
jgi:hypothetical protein